jgi:hypothetical protein
LGLSWDADTGLPQEIQGTYFIVNGA